MLEENTETGDDNSADSTVSSQRSSWVGFTLSNSKNNFGNCQDVKSRKSWGQSYPQLSHYNLQAGPLIEILPGDAKKDTGIF